MTRNFARESSAKGRPESWVVEKGRSIERVPCSLGPPLSVPCSRIIPLMELTEPGVFTNTMPKKVLSVGQCGPDTHSLRRFLETNFDARMSSSDLPDDTMAKLRAESFDLVLINRKLDADYTDGLEILKAIKADPELQTVPTMIVTNYEDHQKEAVAAGAEYGFGKLEYQKPATFERLAKVLGPRTKEQ